MKVNLDFCLAYPTFLDKRNQCLQFREDFHDSTDMEYIIQYHVLLLTKSFLRLSLSTKEQMIMRTYPYPNGQNRCIRLLCVLTGRKAFLCRFRFKRHKDWPVNVLDQNSSICFVGRISTTKTMGRWNSSIRLVQILDRIMDACARIDLPSHFYLMEKEEFISLKMGY